VNRVVHGQRPPKPVRMPMRGDDSSAWDAWRNACQMCRHSSAEYGCVRLGVVEYGNGRLAGFPQVRGGCNAWGEKAA
jgi:hypothetical protein